MKTARKKPKTVIGIRTNSWGIQEEEQYNKLLQHFSPKEIFFIVDSTQKKTSIPAHFNAIYLDTDFIKDNGLLNWKGNPIGWLCGDYFYYAFRKNVKADFYWLIEPDVYLNFEHISDFFKKAEKNTDDALLPYHSERKPESHAWHEAIKYFFGKECATYACLFPFHRLSGETIDYCLGERQKISKLWLDNNWLGEKDSPKDMKKFPNDEVFVSNVLEYSDKKVTKLETINPDAFAEFWFRPFRTKPNKDKATYINRIFHPVKQANAIIEDISNKIINNIKKEKLLKELLPDSNDLESIANGVSDRVRKHINDMVGIRIEANLLKTHLNNLIPKTLKKDSLKVWVWDDRILVIDLSVNDKPITFDFSMTNNKSVELMLFNRGKDLTLSDDLVKKANLTQSTKDNKRTYTKKLTYKDMSELSNTALDLFMLVYQEFSAK